MQHCHQRLAISLPKQKIRFEKRSQAAILTLSSRHTHCPKSKLPFKNHQKTCFNRIFPIVFKIFVRNVSKLQFMSKQIVSKCLSFCPGRSQREPQMWQPFRHSCLSNVQDCTKAHMLYVAERMGPQGTLNTWCACRTLKTAVNTSFPKSRQDFLRIESAVKCIVLPLHGYLLIVSWMSDAQTALKRKLFMHYGLGYSKLQMQGDFLHFVCKPQILEQEWPLFALDLNCCF